MMNYFYLLLHFNAKSMSINLIFINFYFLKLISDSLCFYLLIQAINFIIIKEKYFTLIATIIIVIIDHFLSHFLPQPSALFILIAITVIKIFY